MWNFYLPWQGESLVEICIELLRRKLFDIRKLKLLFLMDKNPGSWQKTSRQQLINWAPKWFTAATIRALSPGKLIHTPLAMVSLIFLIKLLGWRWSGIGRIKSLSFNREPVDL